ncbi:hypothetical protein [Clostridium sp. MD294]|uniref:hypothetical protein n=1 Tax=Clostridium sp. MD294 TaxID=97138 RepID=UPI0002C8C903|nr:hypothetical protein [Clostridium sp. MD294]NDO47278.1 hypothetical protein [Clostridium sp. MD294]USF29653.1 hypothetical protein C820_001054 [Clostridium sp. MD294]
MAICQYEFQFEDEFMKTIENEISKLLHIPMNDMIKKDFKNETLIIRKATKNNYILFLAHEASLLYLVIIRCNTIYENEIQKILFNICDEIEEEYNEDHKKEVVNVFGNERTFLKDLEKMYNISALFDIEVS